MLSYKALACCHRKTVGPRWTMDMWTQLAEGPQKPTSESPDHTKKDHSIKGHVNRLSAMLQRWRVTTDESLASGNSCQIWSAPEELNPRPPAPGPSALSSLGHRSVYCCIERKNYCLRALSCRPCKVLLLLINDNFNQSINQSAFGR